MMIIQNINLFFNNLFFYLKNNTDEKFLKKYPKIKEAYSNLCWKILCNKNIQEYYFFCKKYLKKNN